MNKELMPCPFCGSAPLVNIIEPHKHSWAEMPDHLGSCVIECGCGAGLIDDTQELVSNRWNTRSGSSGDPVQLEKAPEPVAWVRRHPDGSVTNEYLSEQAIEVSRKRSGAWAALILQSEVAELQKQVQALQAEVDRFRNPPSVATVAIELEIDSQLTASAMDPNRMFRQDGDAVHAAFIEALDKDKSCSKQ